MDIVRTPSQRLACSSAIRAVKPCGNQRNLDPGLPCGDTNRLGSRIVETKARFRRLRRESLVWSSSRHSLRCGVTRAKRSVPSRKSGSRSKSLACEPISAREHTRTRYQIALLQKGGWKAGWMVEGLAFSCYCMQGAGRGGWRGRGKHMEAREDKWTSGERRIRDPVLAHNPIDDDPSSRDRRKGCAS